MVRVNLVVENAELDVDVCMPYGPYETKYLKNIDGSKIGNVYDFCFFNKISKILDFWKKNCLSACVYHQDLWDISASVINSYGCNSFIH